METVTSSTMERRSPKLVDGAFKQMEMGVLVGFTGEMAGRLILDAPVSTFGGIAAKMYGMAMEGAMLESFAGEVGNMVAGNTASVLAQDGVELNISVPTVLVGETKLTGFKSGIAVPTVLASIGEMNVVLIVEESN